MGIFKRISDIVSANLNDMVERHEDPEKMLNQAVREMEEAIAKSKREVAKTMASERLVKKELAANEAQVLTWASRAAKAVEAGDDDLARKALTRKHEYEKIVSALEDQVAASTEASQSLRRQLEGMQAKLGEAQRRLGTLTARKRAADVRSRIATQAAGADVELDKNAFEKFDRLSRKVDAAEAEAEAMAELAKSDFGDAGTSLEEEFESGSSVAELEVESELAELKRRKKGE
jgi:phage shock protein A